MLTHGSILVSLLWLVEQIPTPRRQPNASAGDRKRIPTSFWLFRCFISASIHVHFRLLPHESASYSRG